MRVLVVEDERRMCSLLETGLTREGYSVAAAYTGFEAVESAERDTFDLIIVDVRLPGLDGFEVVRRLRQCRNRTPVLMLTARDAVEDRVAGLDVGADDYLTKPFAFEELLARARALVRRGPIARITPFVVGDLSLDPASHEVVRRGRRILLSKTEFALLQLLMRHAGQVVRRDAIIAEVWPTEESVEENTLNAFISFLRRKIDEGRSGTLIQTVRGEGYRIGDPE